MLVNQVNSKRLQCVEANPRGRLILNDAISKALQLVGAQRHPQFLAYSKALPPRGSAALQVSLVLIKCSRPFQVVVYSSAHMSGLRDLFVWKQKATTDAPDTHNA